LTAPIFQHSEKKLRNFLVLLKLSNAAKFRKIGPAWDDAAGNVCRKKII